MLDGPVPAAALEGARQEQLIGSGLEAQVTVSAEGDTAALLREAAALRSRLALPAVARPSGD